MSIGTSIAAGVAQTGLNAQQTSRQQDAKKSQQSERSKRQKENFESHLQAIEEGDDVDRLYIDGQVPEHEQNNKKRKKHEQEQKDEAILASDQPEEKRLDITENGDATPAPLKSQSQLYKHLDISA